MKNLLKLKLETEQKKLNSDNVFSEGTKAIDENKSQFETDTSKSNTPQQLSHKDNYQVNCKQAVDTEKVDGNNSESNTNEQCTNDSTSVNFNSDTKSIAFNYVTSAKVNKATESQVNLSDSQLTYNKFMSNCNKTMNTELMMGECASQLSGSNCKDNTTDNKEINKITQDVVAVGEVKISGKNLPPVGVIERTKPKIGDIVYVKKSGFNGVWSRAVVTEICQHNTEVCKYCIHTYN